MNLSRSLTIALALAASLLASLPATAEMTLDPGTSVTFHHHDLLGSPVMVSDHKGRVLWYENTKPYGESLGKKSSSGLGHLDNIVNEATSNLGYTGHTVDSSTGLVYMKARHYDPVIGRFYSNDPVGFKASNPMMFNRYAYANNNPYLYIDPDGREIQLQTHVVAGSFHHAKLTITPDNQARYANDSRFDNVHTSGKHAGKRFATIGAGPVGIRLKSGINRDRDVSEQGADITYSDIVDDSKARTEDQLIFDLFEAEGYYTDKQFYSFLPRGLMQGYNSNSFISGLLNLLGLSTQTDVTDYVIVPGYDTPVPEYEFEKTEED